MEEFQENSEPLSSSAAVSPLTSHDLILGPLGSGGGKIANLCIFVIERGGSAYYVN